MNGWKSSTNIDKQYVEHKVFPSYAAVAARFHRNRKTIEEIWDRQDNIAPRRPGPHPAPAVIPPRAEDDSLIDVLFNPPRTDDPIVENVASQEERKEDAGSATTAVSQEEKKEDSSSATDAATTESDRTPLRTTLVQVVNGAENTLIIAVYCFTEDILGQAILDAAARDVKIKIYLDLKQAQARPAWPRKFIESNKIEINYRAATSEKVHVKYLVADGKEVCVGSANFSAAALTKYNEEVIVHLCGRRAASFFRRGPFLQMEEVQVLAGEHAELNFSIVKTKNGPQSQNPTLRADECAKLLGPSAWSSRGDLRSLAPSKLISEFASWFTSAFNTPTIPPFDGLQKFTTMIAPSTTIDVPPTTAGPKLQPGLESGHALMEHGEAAFYDFVAQQLEPALGRTLPQMEVRCKNLSVVAEVSVVEQKQSGATSELPSVYNSLKHIVRKLTATRHVTERHVLNRVDAVFEPGTITLVLGQPGSGKTSLMKILSGQFPMQKNVTVGGDVSYNGKTWKELLPKLPQLAAYVPQTDRHFPVLTVQETLEFAHACCPEQ